MLESMAMGKAVIAARWDGPVDDLDESSGMLIEPKSYPDLVADFAEAMTKPMNLLNWRHPWELLDAKEPFAILTGGGRSMR